MKKRISLLLFLSASLFAYGQTLIDQGRAWSYYVAGNPPHGHPQPDLFNYTVAYSFGEPEMSGGQVYYRLRYRDGEFPDYGSPIWENTDLLLREGPGGRIFMKEGSAPEVVVYDFGLETGEVFYNELEGCEWMLTAKDSITLNNGEKRERFIFEDGRTWIKGIGSSISFIPQCSFDPEQLICFKMGENLEYTGDLFFETSACIFVPVNTSEASAEGLKLFPNPVSSTLNIESGPSPPLNGYLVIYDGIGKIIHREKIGNGSSRAIDLKGHAPGPYFIRWNGRIFKFLKGGG